MYLTRYWVNAAQVPVDQGNIDQLVANGNGELVTISNPKQIAQDDVVAPELVAKDNDTIIWNGENVVTSDNIPTTQAVTKDNNVSVTTGVATATIPALQQNHHHDNDYIKFHQSDNLKPRSGIDLQNNQPNILLQHSKTVEELTSSDFVIRGRDITTSNPDDITEQNVGDYQDSQINTNHDIDDGTRDSIQSTDLFLKFTTSRPFEVSIGDKGGSLDTTSISDLSSVRLEHGNTLTGFTRENTNPNTQNAQSESTVVDHTTSQPSLFITLLLSSTASSDFEQENQANSSPGYSTHTEHEELSTVKVADLFTSLDKHIVTKRETSSAQDTGTHQPIVSFATVGYSTTPKSESSIPSETPHHVTTLTNQNLNSGDISGTIVSSSSGSGDIIDNGLSGKGQRTISIQGQPLTTLPSKTSQVIGISQQPTTIMVYIASSDVTDDGNNLFDGFDGLDGRSEFKVKDIILAVSGTIGCMLTVCMLVAFTRCCCKKEKDDDEEENGGSSSGTLKALRSLKRKSKRHGSKNDTSAPSGGGGRESATDVTQVNTKTFIDALYHILVMPQYSGASQNIVPIDT